MTSITEVGLIFLVTFVMLGGIGILSYVIYKLITINKRMEKYNETCKEETIKIKEN
jgi:phage shock protein PspC (stress-responsive transcriptional regulator)